MGLLPITAGRARPGPKRLGMPVENVTVHVTLLGGGFGRKSKPDYGIEAAVLSKAMDGKPVKVVWTRDDDLHNDYFHTVSVEHLEAGVDAMGLPVAWLHRSVAPTIVSTFDANAKEEANWELGMGVINVPFAIPNIRIENPEAIAHTRIGWFRSVSNIPHAFAVQSFVAELAAAAGRDPKDFLLEVIGPPRIVSPQMLGDTWNHGESPERYPVDTGRLRGVAELAAKEAGWGRTLPKGSGLGIAAHYSFVSYVAAVVEVAVRRQRRGDHSARGHCDRLWSDGQSGPSAGTNAGRLRHGCERSNVGRDHLQGGSCATRQFSPIRGNAHACGTARDSRSYRAGRLQQAAGRRRRAGRAASATCAVQCDLCGNRQAHSTVADRRPAKSVDAELMAGRV
jgi:Molybdopterin-binding domain of aldehyde dehydrogenase